MQMLLLFLTSLIFCSALSAQESVHYFDEATMRHITLKKAEFGNTEITVRFAGDPGSAATWVGNGLRKDKLLQFSRIVGEGEDRGTFF
ncbi:MAG: hypothetical protein ABL974_04890, partial [Prosthecobacter sp.]